MLSALLLLQAAQAGTIFTIEANSDTLYAYDTLNDTYSPIGSLGFDFDWGSLTFDPTTRTMYLIHARGGLGLYEVNPRTGAATFIGTHGLSDVFGAAFDPGTGYIYGGSFGTWYAIDPTTARSRPVGAVGTTFSGMDYIPAFNQYVGNAIGSTDFYTVDILTGATTLQASLGSWMNDVGLAWDDDTQRLHGFDYSGMHYAYDVANGFRAAPSRPIGFGSWDGAESVGGGGGPITLQVTQGSCPGPMTFRASNQTPLGNVAFGRGGAGQTRIPAGPCAGTVIPVGNLQLVSVQAADARGVASVSGNLQAPACGVGRLVALDMSTCTVSNIVTP